MPSKKLGIDRACKPMQSATNVPEKQVPTNNLGSRYIAYGWIAVFIPLLVFLRTLRQYSVHHRKQHGLK
jgi:hypothetical protein